ncbi:MAG: GlsB/YeaQ/YmgE family stress response membrane protein [Gammaproteobacteria bacterium]|nr:GlsB/YeaQ/YmgE family stress response membrane protein [Gammaproteobacteria bacterium]
MDVNGLIIMLAIGALAGWLAGTITKGKGFGILGNIVIGIIGAVLGGFLFSLLGITAGGLIGSLVMATVGAVALLFLIRLVKSA